MLVVQSTNNNWKKEFPGVVEGFFTGDNKQLIFQRNDTLFFLSLGSEQLNYTPNISNYKQSQNPESMWVAYQLKNDKNELILKNLVTGKEHNFNSISGYDFNNKGNALLLQIASAKDSASIGSVQWVSLRSGTITPIWSEGPVKNNPTVVSYSFDADGTQLAFIIQERKEAQTINTLWYYKEGQSQAVIYVRHRSPETEPELSLSNSAPFFGSNGQYLFFNLQQLSDNRKPLPHAAKVDIWSYKDSVLQSKQLTSERLFPKKIEYTTVINLRTKQLIRVTRGDETMTCHPQKKRRFRCNYR